MTYIFKIWKRTKLCFSWKVRISKDFKRWYINLSKHEEVRPGRYAYGKWLYCLCRKFMFSSTNVWASDWTKIFPMETTNRRACFHCLSAWDCIKKVNKHWWRREMFEESCARSLTQPPLHCLVEGVQPDWVQAFAQLYCIYLVSRQPLLSREVDAIIAR